MLKNTVRILIANFSTVWKLLLFKLIVFVFAGIIVLPALLKIESFLNAENFWVQLENLFSFFNLNNNLPEFFEKIEALLSSFQNGISSAYEIMPSTVIFAISMLFVGFPFLLGLSEVAVGECLFGSMGSGAKFGFTASFIGNLGKSIGLQLIKTLVSVSYALFVLFVSSKIFLLFQNETLFQILMPITIIIFVWFSYSFFITLFSGWMPAMVVHNNGVFKSLEIGLKATFQKFFRILSNSIVLVMLVIFCSLLLGALGVVLLIPFFTYLLLIFQMVTFFECTGMRYYIDSSVIVTPKKPQELVNISKLKRVI